MKKKPLKCRILLENSRNFQYCQKWPGLPRQLKTNVGFSMFPILGTKLWSTPDWVQYDVFQERATKIHARKHYRQTKERNVVKIMEFHKKLLIYIFCWITSLKYILLIRILKHFQMAKFKFECLVQSWWRSLKVS